MTTKDKTCCFSGHREIPFGTELDKLASDVEIAVKGLVFRGYTDFLAGGAIGFDTLCADTVLKLKYQGYPVVLKVISPFKGQEAKWSREQRETYYEILRSADEVIYTAEEYSKGCYFVRNRFMVEHSSAIVCYLRHETGGTAFTVAQAEKSGLEIIKV